MPGDYRMSRSRIRSTSPSPAGSALGRFQWELPASVHSIICQTKSSPWISGTSRWPGWLCYQSQRLRNYDINYHFKGYNLILLILALNLCKSLLLNRFPFRSIIRAMNFQTLFYFLSISLSCVDLAYRS